MKCDEDPQHVPKTNEEACKTFVEQTKLLVTLASAFIVAPAAVQTFSRVIFTRFVILAEVLFVISVLAGYVALGAIAGSQHSGKFDVYDKGVMWSGRIQFFSYLAGLCLFIYWIIQYGNTLTPSKP